MFQDMPAYIGLFLAIRGGDWSLRMACIKLYLKVFFQSESLLLRYEVNKIGKLLKRFAVSNAQLYEPHPTQHVEMTSRLIVRALALQN